MPFKALQWQCLGAICQRGLAQLEGRALHMADETLSAMANTVAVATDHFLSGHKEGLDRGGGGPVARVFWWSGGLLGWLQHSNLLLYVRA